MSTNQYTPIHQVLHNTPYSQILLHQNNIDSKVYISRRVNQLLRAIGNDLVLSGFDLLNEPETEGLNITFKLTPGMLIQDSTFIEVKYDELIELTINVASFDQKTGYIIIYTDYSYQDSSAENPIIFKIAYINADGQSLVNNTWNSSKNRILLYRYSFVKTSVEILSLKQEDASFEIMGAIYHPKGYQNFTNYDLRLYEHASESPMYGIASDTHYGHVKIPLDSNINNDQGVLSISEGNDVQKGLVQIATEDEAILMESNTKVLTPESIRHIILNLKDIEIQVVDPGITLGTALILN